VATYDYVNKQSKIGLNVNATIIQEQKFTRQCCHWKSFRTGIVHGVKKLIAV